MIEAPNVQRLLNRSVTQLSDAQIMRLWRAKPHLFVRDAFDFNPDPWQADCIELYRTHQRLGMIASKGVGKTGLLAVIGWHMFLCYELPKIAALSITEAHLKSNLWAELLLRRSQSKLATISTTDGKSRIELKGHEGYSFIDARSFPKQADQNQQASALAGLHANNVGFLIDEAGSIPDAVLATADAALSTGDSERKRARLVITANPENPVGLLYRAASGKSKQQWGIYRVSGDPEDPKRAPRVSKQWAQELIDQYGREDPWVMVNVLGQYPKTSSTQLLTEDEILESMNRNVAEEQVKNSQMRLGIDVARGGVDSTVFARRRGLKGYPLEQISSNVLGPELAGKAALQAQEFKIERVFIDNTGGFGSSVVDSLALFPHLDVTPIHYNSKAQDKRYYNKRTEMWVRMRDWVKKGGQLPSDKGLAEELQMPNVYFQNGVFRLEEKEQIKARLGRSPDKADAFAQTFADVEQPSFFAEMGVDTRNMSDEEFVEMYHRSRQSNYIHDETQIDKRYNSTSNYRA